MFTLTITFDDETFIHDRLNRINQGITREHHRYREALKEWNEEVLGADIPDTKVVSVILAEDGVPLEVWNSARS